MRNYYNCLELAIRKCHSNASKELNANTTGNSPSMCIGCGNQTHKRGTLGIGFVLLKKSTDGRQCKQDPDFSLMQKVGMHSSVNTTIAVCHFQLKLHIAMESIHDMHVPINCRLLWTTPFNHTYGFC